MAEQIEMDEVSLEKGRLFRAFVDEFKNESDRAAVIIGAAKLDYLLYQILAKHFLPSVSGKDDLLDGDSPLSTFSAKINICYRLGLIDAGFARALHMIRKIRNSFAHEVSGCKFDNGPHSDRIRELVAPYVNTNHFKKSKELLFGEGKKELYFGERPHHSANFFTMLSILVGRLEWLLDDDIEPLNASNVYGVIPGMKSVSSLKNDKHNDEKTKDSSANSGEA